MGFTAFLEEIRKSGGYGDQIVYIHRIPKREAAYGELAEPLPPELVSALGKMGITDLYTHQIRAIENVRAGKSIVVVTSTASGKTLCYNLPVLETLLAARSSSPLEGEDTGGGSRSTLNTQHSTAFYLFPTKALAQDQLRGLRQYAELEPTLAGIMKAGTYDGDTPQTTRRKLRDEASIILTNPDMLHQGILPYHTRWSRFFADLRYVIIDEIHSYRGIFGSNVANVIRRLSRICRHYGSNPRFICSSATIANPVELAERLTGVPMVLVDDDGSPRGAKQFVLWNPPCIDVGEMERRSSNVEAQHLMVDLMRRGVRTITFGRARIVAELMYKYVRDALQRANPHLAEKVRAYRGGYLPEERREIERQLFSGELMGITSTNALELGIDIGGLDAAIIVGFPGTIASTWQQAGRAGRSVDESLVVFVGYNDPIDQYLMRHPTYFFGQSPEHAVVDPENPYILANHMRCAAFELPLKRWEAASHQPPGEQRRTKNEERRTKDEERRTRNDAQSPRPVFGPQMSDIAATLEEAGDFKQIDRTWYWSKTDFPAAAVNLRTISDNTFTIVDISGLGDRDSGLAPTKPEPPIPDPGPRTPDPESPTPGGRAIRHVPTEPLPETERGRGLPSTLNTQHSTLDRQETVDSRQKGRDGRTCSQHSTLNTQHSTSPRVIGQVDAISAPELVYPEAVYMHEAETYFVQDLDLENKVAYVRPANVDYYTQAILDASIRIQQSMGVWEYGSMGVREYGGMGDDGLPRADHPQPAESQPSAKSTPSPPAGEGRGEGDSLHAPRSTLNGSTVCFGPATVTWATTGFKKIKFYSLDSIGYGKVSIPPQHLETMAFWLIPPAELLDEVRASGRKPVEGLVGMRNLMVHVLPLFAMCDKQDIGGIVDSSNIGSPTIFIYDRYPGGLGFAEKGYEMVEELMRSCLEMIEECACEDGCPSCVGIPTLRPAIHTDPDIFGSFPIPDKEVALMMLHGMLGREAYTPKRTERA